MNRLRATLLVSAALALGAAAAPADLLMTRDGATIETAGPWKVDGRRVLFTLPNGQLSSIRTDEVDLDASALATARAAEAAQAEEEAPAPAPGAPILTLTEDDLPKDESAEEGEEKKAETEAAPNVPLQVVSWEQMPMPDDGGVQLFGTLRNTSRNTITSATLTAILYGEEGGMLATGDAQLNQTTIAPEGMANFRVEFPGLPDFASVKFDVAARGFETRAPEGEEGAEPIEQVEPPGEEVEATDEPVGATTADAESDAAAAAAYEANANATGDEPPPEETEPPPAR